MWTFYWAPLNNLPHIDRKNFLKDNKKFLKIGIKCHIDEKSK